DGNGRTGRLLITFYLCHQNVLERPVLYLSEYLKKHRNQYFSLLDDYRKGNVSEWLVFFLEGVIQICEKAIETSNKIIDLREKNLQKMSSLGRASKNAMLLLKHLYKLPIVNVKKVEEATGLSREAANRLVKRFCKEGILTQKDQNVKYGRLFVYKEYITLFE
ncbi:MAG: Fic family protein, partial [Candidatus Aminicenantes bacterium]|nr:Fic family protein [Candidatus Aminicenantes bacterium]